MRRKLLFLPLILLLFVLPLSANAQEQPWTLPAVEVDLWPEYDNPGILVIYRITLPANFSLPGEFKLRIPAAVGAPNAVAARQPDGSLVNLTYDQQRAGEWNTLTMTATASDLQVEYYDPGLQKSGEQRSFTYAWPGDYPVQNFSVQVQQPIGASEMDLPAQFGSGAAGSDGLSYYTAEIGALDEGQEMDVPIVYLKADDKLSSSSLSVTPVQPVRKNFVLPSWLVPTLLVLVALALIGVGLLLYWRTGKRTPVGDTRSGAQRHRPASVTPAQGHPGDVYCYQCGKRAAPGDAFCRTCGTRLRK